MPAFRHSRPLVCTALALSLGVLSGTVSAARFKPRKALPEGWNATVQFGAEATQNATSRKSTLSGAAEMSYRGGDWEHKIVVEAMHRSSKVARKRKVEAGEGKGDVVFDDFGDPVYDIVRNHDNDRRFVSAEPRWFFRRKKNYLFAIVDYETDEPDGIESSTRHIAGVGYRLLRDGKNYFSAGIGLGSKRLERVAGEDESGGIGYLGLNFVRLIGERMKFEAGLDSDFGDESRVTELDLGVSWRLTGTTSLKFGYEVHMNSDLEDPQGPFDDKVKTNTTIGLKIDVL